MQADGKTRGPVVAAQRLADRQQRHAVQAGLREGHRRTPATRIAADQAVPDWDNTKAGTIFEQMLHQGQGQDRRRRRRQRRPRQRGHRGPEEATASPARSRSPARTPPTRACSTCCRRPVHDRLQGDQEGGRRGLRAGHRAGQGRQGRRRRAGDRQGDDTKTGKDVPSVLLDPQAIYQGQRQGRRRRRLHHRGQGLHRDALQTACTADGIS